ncbi:unnamed protein product [Mytilus coruscus]|uniref:Uncharacterized protein n=1 Tax=Mytilus coruscus TaxID=42192 RepID=A0A6J7ZUQ3_MYTCO|nr:unnamed protein product [Mytilus coruscus]
MCFLHRIKSIYLQTISKFCHRNISCASVLFYRSRSKSSGSRGSNNKRLPHDMNKKGLTKLYNSKVTKVESYSRPLNGFLGKIGIKHTGVVATTKNGGKFLVHKGPGYGKSSSTVVVDAKHMSNKWTKTGEKTASGGKTISDVMKDGYVNKKSVFRRRFKNRHIIYELKKQAVQSK